MSGFFGRKAGEVIEIPTAADLTKRVSALEDAEHERRELEGGAQKIGGYIVKRYSSFINPAEVFLPLGVGVFMGRNKAAIFGVYGAIALRDWLLKEFPLKTPEPEDKKPGGKK